MGVGGSVEDQILRRLFGTAHGGGCGFAVVVFGGGRRGKELVEVEVVFSLRPVSPAPHHAT